ncbi:hypothetical protein BTHER_11151 [Brochothrix thermosphacta DSM 20171 = FSL F6-1036]|nr:hypothetical protein BTHER_11151 [Brochothrix thermosphacta DSM 20171 = FSL F6-1036]
MMAVTPSFQKEVTDLTKHTNTFYKQLKNINFSNNFFFHEESIQYYVNTLFMSESNIRRMVKNLNKELRPKGLFITTNPMKLNGDEWTVRQAFTSFFYEKNRLDFQQTFGENVLFYDTLTEKTLFIMGAKVSMTNALLLKYWLYISVQRTKKKVSFK